jgi:hypothetical protein
MWAGRHFRGFPLLNLPNKMLPFPFAISVWQPASTFLAHFWFMNLAIIPGIKNFMASNYGAKIEFIGLENTSHFAKLSCQQPMSSAE